MFLKSEKKAPNYPCEEYFNDKDLSAIAGLQTTRDINVYVQEINKEISELKEALNITRFELDKLRNELNEQGDSVQNLTSQVKEKVPEIVES